MAKPHSRLQLPKNGQASDQLLDQMRQWRDDDANWHGGRVFSLVYHPGDELAQFLKDAHNLFSSANGLNPTVFPSLKRFETEIISMCAGLFHGGETATGVLTSGGTESILMAVKAAREWARKHKPNIQAPEIVMPASVHPAFNKAAYYLGLTVKTVPVRDDQRADVFELKKALTNNTVMLVVSAPAYPHGVVDPVEEVAALARQNDLWLHVDSCAGGFILPFLEKLGYQFNTFDFRVPGVKSISADLHKYGYAAKGASVLLYADPELRKHQFFAYSGWPGGLYVSPSAAGTRPGGPIAAAWAILNHLGEEGYLEIARRTRAVTERLRDGINAIEGVYVIAEPDSVILSFGSREHDIYAIGDELTLKGWHLDRQLEPPSLHLTLTINHEQIVEEFLADVRDAVEIVKKPSLRKTKVSMMKGLTRIAGKVLPEKAMSKLTEWSQSGSSGVPQRTAAMYGLVGELPNKGDVDKLLVDLLNTVMDTNVPAQAASPENATSGLSLEQSGDEQPEVRANGVTEHAGHERRE